jgi:hypothetical protein
MVSPINIGVIPYDNAMITICRIALSADARRVFRGMRHAWSARAAASARKKHLGIDHDASLLVHDHGIQIQRIDLRARFRQAGQGQETTG